MDKQIITVWPEDEDTWIVSQDWVESEYGDGNNTGSLTSHTLDVFDSEESALSEGCRVANAQDMPLYQQDQHGVPSAVRTHKDARV